MEEKANASKIFSELIEKTTYEDLDDALLERMRIRFADSVGVTASGFYGNGVDMLRDLFVEMGGKPEASVINTGEKMPAMNAAMLNTLQMRSNDFESCHAGNKSGVGVPAHISGTLFPTAWAMGESVGATGKDVMTAIAVGDDLGARLAASMGFSVYNVYDSTGTVNGFAAVATAAKLMGLNAEQIHNALGITLNMVQGTMASTLEHSWLFKFPMANASRTGIFAADLAKRGYQGIEDPLCGTRCFYDMFGHNPKPELLLEDAGKIYYGEVLIKPYAGCCATHHSVKSTLLATGGKAYSPDEVKEIRVHMLGSKVGIVGALWEPGEHSQPFASFSVQATVCNAVLHGGVYPEFETEAQLASDDFQKMLSKYVQVPDLKEDDEYIARVEVELVDGTILEGKCTSVRPGHMLDKDPLPLEYIHDKFLKNMRFGGHIPMDRAEQIWDMCMHMEEVEDFRSFMDLLHV